LSIHYIEHKNVRISYKIIRKNVKNINLRVTPDLKVVVSSNKRVKEESIVEFVESKSKWIYEKLKKFENVKSYDNNKKYISGETVRYLGKQHMLKVVEDKSNTVKYFQDKICIYVEDKNNFKLKEKIYETWLNDRAEEVFKEILDDMYKKVEPYNVEYPRLTIRKMKTRWGSCNSKKSKINMNRHLIAAKKTEVEYVMLHELVHLIHPNHSKDFYNLLGILMPDYLKRKEYLDKRAVREI